MPSGTRRRGSLNALKFDLESSLPTAPRVAVPQTQTLRGNPERMAWLVLFGAFFVCIALTLLVPFFGFQFIRLSTEPQLASLQAIGATQDGVTPVRVNVPNAALPLAIKEPASISENNTILTDNTDTSRAFLTFFDSSTATISPGTQLTLQDMRRPRFPWSDLPNLVTVEQTRGTVRYAVAPTWKHPGNPDGRPLQFLVHTPQFDAWLNPGGSYSLVVGTNSAEIAVRDGSAIVRSHDNSREVFVGLGQRVIAQAGEPLAEPIPAAQDLLANGDFASTVTCDPNEAGPWRCYSDQGGDGGSVNGSIGIVTAGDRRALQIKRVGSNQNSAVTGVRQSIGRDVSDFRTLKLEADVRVDAQNLSGGGYLSTEYPLILRIKYRDVDGNEAEYFHGFYIQNDTNNPTTNGEQIPPSQWIPFDSSNLLASLPIKPFRILTIEVYASGWDYESYISNVRLEAE